MSRFGLRAGLCLVAVTLVVVSRGSAASPAPEPPVKVSVASAKQGKKQDSVPIGRSAGKAPGVVAVSMGPSHLPSLAPGDRLTVSAELPTSTDCIPGGGPCFKSGGYGYNPTIDARLMLASSSTATGGTGTSAVGQPVRLRCGQRRPDRNHHCPVVFEFVAHSVAPGEPCLADHCHLNLVISAYHPKAQRRKKKLLDRLLLGGTAKGPGRVKSGEGRIHVVRFRPDPGAAQVGVVKPVTNNPPKSLPIARGKLHREVVFSVKLDTLEQGTQLAALAHLETAIGGLPYNALISSSLVLACSAQQTKPCNAADAATGGQARLAPATGFNCIQGKRFKGEDDFLTPCLTRKVGVLRIRQTASRALHLNLVTGINVKLASPAPGDRAEIRGGSLTVVKYGPRLSG